MDGRVTGNQYPILYISHTVKCNTLNCHVRCFGLTNDHSWNHTNALFPAHLNTLVFPLNRRNTLQIILHRLHSVNDVNTRLSLPYPLGSVVHLIFVSEYTSSPHQD
jgi:hypothetical protein